MDFIDAHYASLLTFAYFGLAAWLINRLAIAGATTKAAGNFLR